MFTGIVRSVGIVTAVLPMKGGRQCAIRMNLKRRLKKGESVLLSGICTTVTQFAKGSATFFFMDETIEKTSAVGWKKGTAVNIEPALRAGDDLSGHIVTGHIDCRGVVKEVAKNGRMSRCTISLPSSLSRYIVSKGSVAVDGVSLTVVDVSRSRFTISLIPYTLAHTTLRRLQAGDIVNIETDILAKYLEKAHQKI